MSATVTARPASTVETAYTLRVHWQEHTFVIHAHADSRYEDEFGMVHVQFTPQVCEGPSTGLAWFDAQGRAEKDGVHLVEELKTYRADGGVYDGLWRAFLTPGTVREYDAAVQEARQVREELGEAEWSAEWQMEHGQAWDGKVRKPKKTSPKPNTAQLHTDLFLAADDAREAQERIRVLVGRCRAAGMTWQDIADALGMTRQAAWQRWRGEFK